jgi:uncharacterized protein
MKKQKTVKFVLYVFSIGLVASLLYNFFDNRRFRVVEAEIILDRLPAAFDGFRILQISDLHGEYFGVHQVNLIQNINSIQYDMIAFTGDMNSSNTAGDTIENASAILDLLDGIEKKDNLFWVDGNVGPYAVERDGSFMTGDLTEMGGVLQEKGCRILILPHAIQRGEDIIWITPALSTITLSESVRSLSVHETWTGGKENDEKVQAYFTKTNAAFEAIRGNAELKILLEHTPKQTNLSEAELAMMGDLDYDLILAGHYHGGQWRLPLIGAVYIPSPTHGINNSGWFPAQNDVKGWSFYGRTPQYVSAGLGASGHSVWTDFRLFNTPEINLITLKSRSQLD